MTSEKIPVGDFRLGEEEKLAIKEVLDSGRLSEGQKVREFEQAWAKFVGTKKAIATSSGTAALICGLTALKYHPDYSLKQGQKMTVFPLMLNGKQRFVAFNQINCLYTFNLGKELQKEAMRYGSVESLVFFTKP